VAEFVAAFQRARVVAGEPPSLHVDAAAAAALLAIEKTRCGIYNIAEPNGYLSTDKARRERIASKQIARSFHPCPRIQRASEADIPEIVNIVNAAFQVERDFRMGVRTSFADVKRLMEGNTFLVAVQDDQVVGAIMVRVNESTGYLGMLSVRPGLQGSGIGRALLQEAEALCRAQGCTEMTLTTGSVRRELLHYKAGLHSDRHRASSLRRSFHQTHRDRQDGKPPPGELRRAARW
jgi:GNAT superfamily N-acetyltransferase